MTEQKERKLLYPLALSDVLSLQDRPSQEDSEGSYTRVAHQMLADLAAGGVAHGSRSAPQVSTVDGAKTGPREAEKNISPATGPIFGN